MNDLNNSEQPLAHPSVVEPTKESFLTPKEIEYLGSLPPETQELLKEDPSLLRAEMEMDRAVLMMKDDPTLTMEDAKGATYDEIVASSEPQEKPQARWVGVKDIARGAAQIPSALVVRGSNALGSTVGWGLMKAADLLGENIFGVDVVSQETLDKVSKGLDRDTMDWLIRYGDTLEAPKTFAGTMTKEVGTFTTGYLALGYILPVLAAGVGITRAAGVANNTKAASTVMGSLWGWLKANTGRALVADVTFTPPEGLTETAAVVKVMLKGGTDKEIQEAAESWADYMDNLPMYKKLPLRAIESLAAAAGTEMIFKTPSMIKWIAENVIEPLSGKLGKTVGTGPEVVKNLAKIAEPMADAYNPYSVLDDLVAMKTWSKPDPLDLMPPPGPTKAAITGATDSLVDAQNPYGIMVSGPAPYTPSGRLPDPLDLMMPLGVTPDAAVRDATEGILEEASELMVKTPKSKAKGKVKSKLKTPPAEAQVKAITKGAKEKLPKVTEGTTAEATVENLEKTVAATKASEVPAPKTPITTSTPILPKGKSGGVIMEHMWEVQLLKTAEREGFTIGEAVDLLKQTGQINPKTSGAAATKRAAAILKKTKDKYQKGLSAAVDPTKIGKWKNEVFDGITGEPTGKQFKDYIVRNTKIISMRKGNSGAIPSGFDIDPDDLFQFIGHVSHPMAVAPAAMLLDQLDGETDLDVGTVVGLMAAGVGARALSMQLRMLSGRIRPDVWLPIRASVAKGSVDILSALKGWMSDPSTPLSVKAAYASSLTEDLLGKSAKITRSYIDNKMKHLAPAANRSTVSLPSALTIDTFGDAALGASRGVSGAVDALTVNDETNMILGFSELFNHSRSMIPQLPVEGSLQVAERWNKFILDYGVDAQTAKYLSDSVAPTVEEKLAFLVAGDSFEQHFAEALTALASSDPTMDTLGQFMTKLGQFKAFRAMLREGLTGLNEGMFKGINMADFGDFMRLIPDEVREKAAGRSLDLWYRKALENFNKLKPLWSGATEAGAKRQALMSTLDALDSNHYGLSAAVSTLFNMALSRPALWSASATANGLKALVDLTNLGFEYGISKALGREPTVIAIRAAWDGWLEGLLGSLPFVKKALLTGVKDFDPTGVKPYYTPAMIAGSSALEGTHQMPMMEKILQFFADVIGVTPGNIMKALDVAPQMAAHNSMLERRLSEMAFDRAEASGVPYAVALQQLKSDKKLLADLSLSLLDASRGKVWIKPEQTLQVVDNNVVLGQTMVEKGLDLLGQIHRFPPVTAMQLFFSTKANAVQSGLVNSPLGLFHDLLHGNKGILWNKLTGKGKTMSPASQRRLNDAFTQLFTRAAAGTVVAYGVYKAMEESGWLRVSKSPNLDVALKNRGFDKGGWYNTRTKEFARLDQLDNLNYMMAFIDLLAHQQDGYGNERSVEQMTHFGILTSMLLDLPLAETGILEIKNSIQDFFGPQGITTKDNLFSWFDRKFTKLFNALNPSLLRAVGDSYRGFRQTYKDSLSELMVEAEPLLDQVGRPRKTGAPISIESPVWPARPSIPEDEVYDTLAKYGVDVGDLSDPEFGGLKLPSKLGNMLKISQGKFIQRHKAGFLTLVNSLEKRKRPRAEIEAAAKRYMREAKKHALDVHFRKLQKYYKEVTGE